MDDAMNEVMFAELLAAMLLSTAITAPAYMAEKAARLCLGDSGFVGPEEVEGKPSCRPSVGSLELRLITCVLDREVYGTRRPVLNFFFSCLHTQGAINQRNRWTGRTEW
eukprot:8162785-Heterocapsa_arctica.AAC.1